MSGEYDHAIQRYKDATKNLQKAKARIEELTELLQYALKALEHPQESGVSDASGLMGEPRFSRANYTLEALKWPRIEQIDAAFRDYQKASLELRGAYYALPNEDKALVAAPD